MLKIRPTGTGPARATAAARDFIAAGEGFNLLATSADARAREIHMQGRHR